MPSGKFPIPRGQRIVDNSGRSVFTVEWFELKEMLEKTLAGNIPAFSQPSHKEWCNEYLGLSGDFNAKWRGYDRADVKRWLVNGYQLDGLVFDNPPIPIREKRRFRFQEEGEEFQLDLFLDGNDNHYGDWTKRQIIPGLAVECEMSFSSGVKAEVTRDYFQFLCRALYALETSGIDLDVTLTNSVQGLMRGGNSFSTRIRVKRENEASDFHAWSAMLSPAALRSYIFCAKLLHGENAGKTVDSGLGRPESREWSVKWNSERRLVQFSIDGIAGSFPESRMETQLREALKAIHNG